MISKVIKVKRAMLSVIVAVSMMLSLIGCASSEEKDKGRVVVESARHGIESLVKTEYSGWEIVKLKNIFEHREAFDSYSTEFIEITLKNETDTIKLIYDTITNDMYSNKRSEKATESIEEQLGFESDWEIDIEFKAKGLDKIGSIADGYYIIDYSEKEKDNDEHWNILKDPSKYRIYAEIIGSGIGEDNTVPIEIYSIAEKLSDIDYKIIAMFGVEENQFSKTINTLAKTGIEDIRSKSECKLLQLENVSGTKTENIIAMERLDIPKGKIIYNRIKHDVHLIESETEIGKKEANQKENAFEEDIGIQIKSLDSSNENNEFIVISDKHPSIVYVNKKTFETVKKKLDTLEIFSIIPSYYEIIKISGIRNISDIIFSLYTEQIIKDKAHS